MTSAIGSTSPRSEGTAVRTRRSATWHTPAVRRRKPVGSTRPEAACGAQHLTAVCGPLSRSHSASPILRKRPPIGATLFDVELARESCGPIHEAKHVSEGIRCVEASFSPRPSFDRTQLSTLPCAVCPGMYHLDIVSFEIQRRWIRPYARRVAISNRIVDTERDALTVKVVPSRTYSLARRLQESRVERHRDFQV